MKPIVIGGVVAVAIVGAFAIGMQLQEDDPAGPAERAGKALDEAASDIGRAVEDATD